MFCESPSSTLSEMSSVKSERSFKAGEAIFRSGEVSAGIYCVRTGTVKIEAVGDNGQAHILHIVNGGGVLGLKASLEGAPYVASAIAMGPTEVCFIPKSTMDRLLKTDPSLALQALRSVALELEQMEKRFCNATDLSASERIAEALLHLKDRFLSQQWSRRELAEWASTTTETVIRTLSQFEKEGLIELDGRSIKILSRDGLLEKARIFV